MRAIATKISVPERTAFCVANNCRPYLSVGPPGKGKRESFRFTEAIEAFGEQLFVSDLAKSYERAGLMFTGTQTFLCQLTFLHSTIHQYSLILGKMAKYFLVMNDQVALELHNHRKDNPTRRAPKRNGDPMPSGPAKQ